MALPDFKSLTLKQWIRSIGFYTLIFLIPTVELALQLHDWIWKDQDRYWNGVLDGNQMAPGRGGGWFYWGIDDSFFGNKKLDFNGSTKYLKEDLRRKTVTKDLYHTFNILVIIATGGMIWFYEGRMLCNLKEFVSQKKGQLMLAALLFFAFSCIPGIIILILLPNTYVDLDDHQNLFRNALKKLVNGYDKQDAYIRTNDNITLGRDTWIRILTECRYYENDHKDLKTTGSFSKFLKNITLEKKNPDLYNELIKRHDHKMPFLEIDFDGLKTTYDITWLRDFGFCPVEPGVYMLFEMLEIFLLCVLPIIFFGVKLLRLRKQGAQVNPANEAAVKDFEKNEIPQVESTAEPNPESVESLDMY